MASTDSRPVPIKNTAFRAVFPILDADGDLVTGATGLDSEVSKDQGTFADCTNEATEIATSSGMYYLDLTSTEMNADCVAVIVKTTSSGAKTTVLVFYPEEAGDINVDVTAWNGTAIPGVDTAGYPKVTIKDGTGTGEIDTTSGGVLVAAIAANAITATAIASNAITSAKIASGAITSTGIAASAIGASQLASNAITSAKIASGAITSTGIAASAIGASQLATGAITNATFAAGAINAAAIAADAIGASELAADAVAEIADAIWDEATSGHVTAGSYGLAASDILADTADMQPKLGTPAGASVSADIAAMQVSADSLSNDVGLVRDRLNALATPPQTIGSTGNDTTHIHVPGWTYGDDEILDQMLVIYDDSSSEYHARWIADWVNATKLATVATLPFTPEGATDLVWVLSIRRDSGLTAAETRTAVGLASANLDTQLTAIDDYIDTEVAAIKAKTDLIPASPAATSDIPSAATIADAVWDEALSGHTTAGSGGKALGDIDTHTDTETGAAAIRAAVGLASANLDTQLAAVQADTDDIQTRLPAALVSGRIDASVGAMAANVVTASAIATDAIGASELAADAVAEIGTAVWATAARTLTAATNITSTGGTTVPQTGDSYARLGAPAGASVSADVAAVKTDTGNILTKLLKYVQLLVRKDAAIATDNATELTAINANGGSGAGSFDNTTDSEQALRDRGDAAWITATGFSTLDAAGVRTAVGLASANLDTQLTAIDDYIDTEVAAIKAKTDNLPASPAATSDIPSAATIADAVWDEALSGHTTAGSGGKALGDIDTHTDTEVASILAAVDTEVAAIKAKTDQLTFTTANQVDATTMSMAANALTAAATASDFGTEVATAVWASATRTLSALGFTLSASDLAADTIGASELAADAVTEIVNAVLTTAMTESYNADGAAPTLAQAMFLCMQRLTEFAISGTTVTVKKLDGSTTAYTLTLDDATSPTSSTRAT